MAQSLRIGCVKYLNAQPLIHGWPGEVRFEHPAVLCRELARGELDVALVSSFEFLRNPIYQIVDGVCVASDGPVFSVIVVHADDWENVRAIELDPASQTSVNLLRCLLARSGRKIELLTESSASLAPPEENRARLLIGDQAIRFREKFGERYRYFDLAEQWQNLTGLPFVFAVWLIRPEVKQKSEIAAALRERLTQNLAQLDRVIAAQTEFSSEFCAEYFHRHLHFEMTTRDKLGLREFQKQLIQLRIIAPPQRETEFV